MLFLCCVAGMFGSSGWMIFWAICGMLFSDRPGFLFVLPLIAACAGMTHMGVAIILFQWVGLLLFSANEAVNRHEQRVKDEVLVEQARAKAAGAHAFSSQQATPRTID